MEEFAEWVGVEYTVAPLTQKDNICRPHLTCTNTHPHVVHTGRKYFTTTQVGRLSHQKRCSTHWYLHLRIHSSWRCWWRRGEAANWLLSWFKMFLSSVGSVWEKWICRRINAVRNPTNGDSYYWFVDFVLIKPFIYSKVNRSFLTSLKSPYDVFFICSKTYYDQNEP